MNSIGSAADQSSSSFPRKRESRAARAAVLDPLFTPEPAPLFPPGAGSGWNRSAGLCWGGRPPTASAVPDCGVFKQRSQGSRPMTIIRIGLDTSKHVFQAHGVEENEEPVLRRQLRRGEMTRFFAKLGPTGIGLEACGAAHYWARVLRGLGHEVVLIPPQYVKPPACAGAGSMSSAARTMRSTRRRSARR